MLLSIIVKTIPRSPRAFLALLVMVGSTGLLFSSLSELFAPAGADNTRMFLKIAVGCLIGIPSTAVFYYFQHMDEAKSHAQRELDVLNNYAEAERRERVYKQNTITPVFDSRGGEIGNEQDKSAHDKQGGNETN